MSTASRGSSVAPVAAAIAALVGVLVMAGWAFDVPLLRSPFAIPTLPNTALLFFLGGASLWLVRPRARGRPPLAVLSAALAVLVLAAGATFLAVRLTGHSSPIDALLFRDALLRMPYRPLGVPASNTNVCLLLAGAALLLVNYRGKGGVRVSQALAIIGLSIALLALVGHLYGVSVLYSVDAAAGMAIPTAVGFAALHIGILFARPDRGFVALLTGDDLGASLLRRVLPISLLVPILLGWLWIRGRSLGLVTREGGAAMIVVLTMLVLLAVLLRAGYALRATDRARQALLATETMARTEAQELAAALAQRTEEAEIARAGADQANRVKSEFLATMSHELRTPLNAVIGYTQLLTDEVTGPLNGAQRRQLERISVSARHLLGLIDEVLSLARLEAGRETLAIEPVDAHALLADVATMIEPMAAAKGLAFHVVAPPGPLTLETDAGKLRQILVNLLSNAVKFTDAGEVSLAVCTEGRMLRCEVRDSGIGIAGEHLDRVFDAFWQVEGAASRRAPGTGLGLSVSRRLARLLGGDISVESERGRGSTFRVTLPVVAERGEAVRAGAI